MMRLLPYVSRSAHVAVKHADGRAARPPSPSYSPRGHKTVFVGGAAAGDGESGLVLQG